MSNKTTYATNNVLLWSFQLLKGQKIKITHFKCCTFCINERDAHWPQISKKRGAHHLSVG